MIKNPDITSNVDLSYVFAIRSPNDLSTYDADELAHFEHFTSELIVDETYIGVLTQNNSIAGMVGIKDGAQGELNIGMIEVAGRHRGNKIGLRIVSEVFGYAESRRKERGAGQALVSTPEYTMDGKRYLRPHMDMIKSQFPNVKFVVYPGL